MKNAARAEHRPVATSRPSLLASASAIVLSLLFTLCGVGIALLGAALPAFLAHWSLTDRDAGLLFFLSWLGAALGALLSRGNRVYSVGRGLVLVSGASFALIYAGRISAFPLIFCYGLGLGIAITSISLLRSQRQAARRTQELNRLNLLWAAGAVACPALTAHALRTSGIAYLFALLGASFALGAGWVAVVETRPISSRDLPSASPPAPAEHRPAAAPMAFCVISLLAVGIEASVGGWLTTYVKRLDQNVTGAVTATTSFWAGLLIARALNSTTFASRFSLAATLRCYACLLAVALCALNFAHAPVSLPLLAFAIGFSLGPLYPMLLSAVLSRYRANAVFFSAGLGSAILPWLTGVLSSHAGSLRAGLRVPLIAGCMLVLLLALRSGLDAAAPEQNAPA